MTRPWCEVRRAVTVSAGNEPDEATAHTGAPHVPHPDTDASGESPWTRGKLGLRQRGTAGLPVTSRPRRLHHHAPGCLGPARRGAGERATWGAGGCPADRAPPPGREDFLATSVPRGPASGVGSALILHKSLCRLSLVPGCKTATLTPDTALPGLPPGWPASRHPSPNVLSMWGPDPLERNIAGDTGMGHTLRPNYDALSRLG